MIDRPDPDNPGVSIAYAIGALVDSVERVGDALERIALALDEGESP